MMNDDSPFELLVEFLLKSALIVAFGFAVVAVFRKWSSEWKHLLWMHVFAVALVLPIVLALPRIELIPAIAPQPGPVQSVSNFGTAITSAVPIETTVGAPGPVQKIGWKELVLLAWLCGCLAILMRSVVAGLRLRELERNSHSPDRETVGLFRKLARRTGVDGASIYLSENIESPFTWGLTKPRILLPAASREWRTQETEMIILHELEHVRRRDSFGVLISRLFLTLNWPNPLAWIAFRQAIRFREEACDERVILAGHDAPAYAEMLFRQAKVANAKFLQTCATAVAETGTIERRVQMILKNSPISNSASGSSARARIFIILLTLIFLGVGFVGSQTIQEKPATEKEVLLIKANEEKLEQIKIPKLEFTETPLSNALAFLRQRSVELDVKEADPARKGFNFVLNAPGAENTKITLRLSNVPLSEALRYTTKLAQLTYSVTPHAIVIRSPKSTSSELVTNVYEVPGDFTKVGDAEFSAKEILEKAGVEFGEGAAAIMNPETSQLIIRNTQEQIEKAEIFLESPDLEKKEEFMKKIAEGWVAPAKGEGKLGSIEIPSIEFRETPLADALEFLQMRSVELDVKESDPAKKGVNIIFEGHLGESPRTITLRLVNVPLSEAIRYTAELAGCTYVEEKHAVLIRPKE